MESNTNQYKCYSCTNITDISCPTCDKWSVCRSCFEEIIKTTIHCKMKVCCDECNTEFDQKFINKFITPDMFEPMTTQKDDEPSINDVTSSESSEIKELDTLFECIICTDSVSKSSLITCEYCNKTCCNECFQHYMSNTNINPKCMHCSITLLFENIIKMSDKEWYTNTYRPNLKNLLFIEEKKLIQSSVNSVNVYIDAQSYTKVPKITKVRDYYDYWNNDWHYFDQQEELTLTEQNANRCVQEYGKGWVGFNFVTNIFEDNTTKKLNVYDTTIFPCPIPMCLGFATHGICNLCNRDVCCDCREQKFNNHKCNPDTIKSIQALTKGSRGCPKCYIPISKIEGCDQMFCTECKTTFSWNTGRIVNDNEWHHNPHYKEWIDKNRKNEYLIEIQRLRNGDYNCNEYIKLEDLTSCFPVKVRESFKKINSMIKMEDIFKPLASEEQYLAVFVRLHQNILHVRATAGNHANVRPIDNHDLRVQLLTNEIDETKFKELIETRNYDYNKSMMYCNIYMMVYTSAIILFDNLHAYSHNKIKLKMLPSDFYFEIYLQFQKILEFANNKLDYNKSIFGNDPRFIKFHR